MAICERKTSFIPLELPTECEDLEGLVQADLHAVVVMLTQRAHERLMLTRREHHALQQTLWNGLAEAVNRAMEPLSAQNR